MRIGFCCKWLNSEKEFGGMKVNAKDRDLNGRSTTMRWLREHPEEAEQRQLEKLLAQQQSESSAQLGAVRTRSGAVSGLTEE